MKAVVVYEAGGPEKLVLTETAKPKLREGWSLIRVRGFGINRSEIFTRMGLSPSVCFPRILGIECVGEIVESQVFSPGQRVISIMGEMGREFDGSYAEYTLLPNRQIYTTSSRLDWPKLAAIPETYYTAFGSMQNLSIREGDQILVRGAASAASIAFVNLVRAKYKDISIFASTRTKEKGTLLLEAGYKGILSDNQHVLSTDLCFDKILELVGPASIKNSLLHLNPYGILCSTGQLGRKWFLEDFDPIMELKNNVYLTTFYSGNVSQEKIDEMFQYIETYRVEVPPAKIFKLEELSYAHQYIESRQGFGKAICLP